MFERIAQKYEFERLGTNWTTEIVAGIALFMSLSYIFIVNPAILTQAGIPSGAVFFATVVASGVSTLVMGLWPRLPFALAPGLEANGFFAFVVVASIGFSWQEGLGLVFWSGVLCLIFTVIPARQKIIDAIPEGLKSAVSTTVGVFVTIIGLVVADMLTFESGLPSGVGSFSAPKAMLLYAGFAISVVLSWKRLRFPAGMLVAIIACTFIARAVGVVPDTPPADTDQFFAAVLQVQLFSVFADPRAWTVLLVFFMIDFYGSIGKFIGLTRATTLQTKGQVRNIGGALYVDGLGTVGGSLLGTSTIITYVESAVAIGQGGRTGIVAIVCGSLMLLSVFFSEIVSFVPVAAASGVLVYVGWLLLPKYELLDAIRGRGDAGTLDRWDFTIVALMGLIAAITFSLDKSLLVGFWFYSLRQMITQRGRVNPYLFGSALVLSVAMAFQYFGVK